MTYRSMLLVMTALTISSANANSAQLGRLFFSPAERLHLDQLRNGENTTPPVVTEEKIEQAPEVPQETITLNGFVNRSSGNDTTWINNVARRKNQNILGITVIETGKASISLQTPSGKEIDLKAGQTFTISKGTIREGFDTSRELSSTANPPKTAPSPHANSEKKSLSKTQTQTQSLLQESVH